MQRLFSNVDWRLAIPVLILLIISLTTLFSINAGFFRTQLFFAFVAIFLYVLCSQITYFPFKQYSLHIYVISIIILALVLFLGIESRGAVRWLDILGFRIQFSEILKPVLAISFAGFLSKRKNSLFDLGYALLLLFPVAFLIFRQPDLGNAIIYGLTVVLTLVFYGFPLLWFGIGVVFLAVLIPFLFRFLHEYQQQRLLTFLHLTNDPLGTSYNAIQSVIAVGSGIFLGKGLGQGTQSTLRFLPERHTDFIFATLSEEMGFVGGLIVVLCFAFLLYRLYELTRDESEGFTKIFTASCFWLIFIQFVINIGMNIGIMPVVGVTLLSCFIDRRGQK